MAKQIIVTGATGTVGGKVTRALIERGHRISALVRAPEKAVDLRHAGARLVQGRFEDGAALQRAFEGADVAISITPANARAEEQAQAILDAARAAGVAKIVRLSALRASPDGPTDNTRQHDKAEKALQATGLRYVILRPQMFLDLLLISASTIAQESRIYFGAGDARIGAIDTRDVADCLVEAAARDDFDGQTLELTGPATITFHDIAAAVGRELGREVSYVPVTPQAMAEAARSFGADEWTATLLHDYCAAYANGFGDYTTREVARILGRPPRSLADFARDVLGPAAMAQNSGT